jgi:hypothetical protein
MESIMNNSEKRFWGIVVLAVLVVPPVLLGVSKYQSDQKNNQFVRPNPDGPPAPVVPELPDIAAKMSTAKSTSEGLVEQVKDLGQNGRISARELDHGRQLFTKAKADFDGCIDFLCVGLDRRFNADDPTKINKLLETANDSLREFESWANAQINPKSFGATDGQLGAMSDSWLDRIAKQNEKAIQQLKEGFQQCRMRSWAEITVR